jgi:DNA-binding winged helix-turn-helix (wHTH) protein
MLKLTDLALKPDLQVGPMLVSPSRRLLEGPGGFVHLEPLIMQVFLLLLDAGSRVVTRNELFDQCWGGVYVGDDSLNRVIGKVRRACAQIAPGLFEIETIPRTGYRLTGALAEGPRAHDPHGDDGADFDALMQQAAQVTRNAARIDARKTLRVLEQAVDLRPDSAKAWGLLALLRSMMSVGVDPKDAARAIDEADNAAHKAFALDPEEPNALLAMFELQGPTLDWFTRDLKLRQIIAIDPKNVLAITELVALLQSAGLNAESWELNEQALALEPLSPDLLSRRALKLWIAGRISEADKVIDQLRNLFPSDRWAWWVRFLILAFTGRAVAAGAMLQANPGMLDADSTSFWQVCLPGLSERSARSMTRTRDACLEAARDWGGLAAQGVMVLSELGELDAAFDVSIGFLLWRGPIVRKDPVDTKKKMGPDSSWRTGLQWLFTPPCAAMRADPRFPPLCDELGLADYWRSRGLRPDYQHRQG